MLLRGPAERRVFYLPRLPFAVYVSEDPNNEAAVLKTIVIGLLALWLLGIVSAVTLGGFIHVLLWAAIAVVLLSAVQGRKIN